MVGPPPGTDRMSDGALHQRRQRRQKNKAWVISAVYGAIVRFGSFEVSTLYLNVTFTKARQVGQTTHKGQPLMD